MSGDPQLDIAKDDLARAQRDAREMAKVVDDAYTPFLMNMSDAWRNESMTGERPKLLASAPKEIAKVYDRYRDARNRLAGFAAERCAPVEAVPTGHRWTVTEHMAATDFERRITEEVEDIERRKRMLKAHLRRVREAAGPLF